MSLREKILNRWRADGIGMFAEIWSVAWQAAYRALTHAVTRRKYGALGRRSCVLRPQHLTNPRFMFIGDDVVVREGARIEAIRHYGEHSFNPRITIGDRTFAEYRLHIACANRVEIGSDVLFAGDVFISDLQHGFGGPGRHPLNEPISVKSVRIGNGCWIGERACIMPGVELGDGCVVGANAVVTKSFPAYSIVAGVPARKLRDVEPATNASTTQS